MERRMNYSEFSRRLLEGLKNYFGPGAKVEVRKVRKNNGVELDSIFIQSEDDRIAPVIYVQDMFDRFKVGMDVRSLVKQIVDIRERSKSFMPFDPERLACFDEVAGMLAYRLVNRRRNAELLSHSPHRKFLDMALVYMCVFKDTDYGNGSVVVTDSLLEEWGVDKGELEIRARESAPDTLPARIRNMADILRDSLGIAGPLGGPCIKVITNSIGMYGASAIYYEGLLGNLAAELGDDLILLPSSVHEMLAVPAGAAGETGALRELVRTVNLTEVSPQEYLSDNVYRFFRDKNRVEICEVS